jgi:hypothetical protein
MKTLTTSILLSVIFLSAGAFAGGNRDVPRMPSVAAKSENVTVMSKNGVWPPAGQISMEPCSVRRCLDV